MPVHCKFNLISAYKYCTHNIMHVYIKDKSSTDLINRNVCMFNVCMSCIVIAWWDWGNSESCHVFSLTH